MKKRLNVTNLVNELEGASAFFPQADHSPAVKESVLEPTAGLAQNHAQKVEQVSNPMSRPLSNKPPPASSEESAGQLTAEDIETMTFELRKERKTKVNTVIVDAWKEEIDRLAFQLKVGKYELLEFIIGSFLEKVKRKK